MTAGDILIQFLEFKQKYRFIDNNKSFLDIYDYKRSLNLGSYAAFFLGPFFYIWY